MKQGGIRGPSISPDPVPKEKIKKENHVEGREYRRIGPFAFSHGFESKTRRYSTISETIVCIQCAEKISKKNTAEFVMSNYPQFELFLIISTDPPLLLLNISCQFD